jgi:hypothetical protein
MKSRFPAHGKGLSEAAPRHMELRLGKKESAVRFQKGLQFRKEPSHIRHFVCHPESEDEIGLHLDPQAVLAAAMQNDPIGHAYPTGPALQDSEHLWLEIDGNNPSAGTYELCHADGEKAHAAAYIGSGHAGLDVGGQEAFRIVEKAAQRIVKTPTKPPGANHCVHSPSPSSIAPAPHDRLDRWEPLENAGAKKRL